MSSPNNSVATHPFRVVIPFLNVAHFFFCRSLVLSLKLLCYFLCFVGLISISTWETKYHQVCRLPSRNNLYGQLIHGITVNHIWYVPLVFATSMKVPRPYLVSLSIVLSSFACSNNCLNSASSSVGTRAFLLGFGWSIGWCRNME